MNRFLIQVFGANRTQFSIIAKPGQKRKELIKEVDDIIGHLNYGAENYKYVTKQDYLMGGCFTWAGE